MELTDNGRRRSGCARRFHTLLIATNFCLNCEIVSSHSAARPNLLAAEQTQSDVSYIPLRELLLVLFDRNVKWPNPQKIDVHRNHCRNQYRYQ